MTCLQVLIKMMVCIIYVPNMYTQITFVIFHQCQDGRHCAKIPYKRYSTVPYVFSFIFFGDLENYTFLETLGPTECEKQCLHFFQAPYGRHLGFSKWRRFFL